MLGAMNTNWTHSRWASPTVPSPMRAVAVGVTLGACAIVACGYAGLIDSAGVDAALGVILFYGLPK